MRKAKERIARTYTRLPTRLLIPIFEKRQFTHEINRLITESIAKIWNVFIFTKFIFYKAQYYKIVCGYANLIVIIFDQN